MVPSKGVGTFELCVRCPVHSTCCRRVKKGGEVDTPVLRRLELQQIENASGLSMEAFSEESSSDGSIRRMRTGSEGCIFYRHGRCEIYTVRPLDCRLFPYDIRQNADGGLIVIAYTSLCPEAFDPTLYRSHAKRLVSAFGEEILPYSRFPSPGMADKPYVILGSVAEICEEPENDNPCPA